MYLYNLTLQKGTGVTHAVHGNFSGGKHQEVILSRGKSLELVRPDSNTGKVHTVLSVEVFGCIRALMSFRLTGGTKGECAYIKFEYKVLWHESLLKFQNQLKTSIRLI